MTMTRTRFSLLILILASLACGIQLPSDPDYPSILLNSTPTDAPAVQSTPVSLPTLTITANVWLRDYADRPLRVLLAGAEIDGWCGWQVCYVDGGTVWRGCTSEAGSRGCGQR